MWFMDFITFQINKGMPRNFCSECRESFGTLVYAREHLATEHIIKKADKYNTFQEVVKMVDGFYHISDKQAQKPSLQIY